MSAVVVILENLAAAVLTVGLSMAAFIILAATSNDAQDAGCSS
jgi:hypothetical protein